MPTIANVDFIADPDAPRLQILGSQVHRILAGGDVTADSQWGRREVMLALEEVRAARQGQIDQLNADILYKDAIARTEYYRKQYFEDLDALFKLGGTADAWIRTYTLPVLTDSDRGLKYFELPAQFIAIRRYQNLPSEEGIRHVERVKWAANGNFAPRFIPTANGTHALFQSTFRGGMQGNILVVREDDRGYLHPDSPRVVIPDETLRVQFVLRPGRDELPAPGLIQDATDMDLVMGAVALLLKRGPEDKVSDNNVPTAQTA